VVNNNFVNLIFELAYINSIYSKMHSTYYLCHIIISGTSNCVCYCHMFVFDIESEVTYEVRTNEIVSTTRSHNSTMAIRHSFCLNSVHLLISL